MAWTDEIENKRNEIKNQEETARRIRQNKHHSLAPMVMRVLDELGRSLWGGFLFFHKYKFYDRGHLWELCDDVYKGEYDFAKNSLTVEIDKDMKHFQIRISRINPEPANRLWAECNDLSEDSLKEGLAKVAIAFKK